MGQASIVKDTVNGIPDLGHDATLEELVLVGRHLVVAMVAMFCYDKVWPVLIHVFDVNLVLSGNIWTTPKKEPTQFMIMQMLFPGQSKDARGKCLG